jgi:hypothetical protein
MKGGQSKMKVSLHFLSGIYNCEVIIKDTLGTRNYDVNLEAVAPDSHHVVEIDVENDNFELTVIPKMTDYESALADMDIQNWKEKLAQKAVNALLSALDKMMLRVGCTYVISKVKEHDVIYLTPQEYLFGTFDKFDLFELIPMAYMFFEASYNGALCKCSNAFPINRKEVVSCAKKLSLSDFGLHLILTYPIQVGRIKKLTSNKKVKRTLIKFHRLNEQETRKILDKKEKFMSR